MNKKLNTNYCNQTNLPCYVNAQHWYFINALNKVKVEKNPQRKAYYSSIVNYYTNGRINQ